MYVRMYTMYSERSERLLDPLELWLQMAVSYRVGDGNQT